MAIIISGSVHSIRFFQAPILVGMDWQLTLISRIGFQFGRFMDLGFDFGEDMCSGRALSSRESMLGSPLSEVTSVESLVDILLEQL